MDLNIRKITNHTPSPEFSIYTVQEIVQQLSAYCSFDY